MNQHIQPATQELPEKNPEYLQHWHVSVRDAGVVICLPKKSIPP